ncbi:hypothetical protein EI427_14310 [Flammeovirga pectinis]|uniref:Uncharacterized protein n=1 Tax=Flammeovirga pectinis TaxID=2494373 RepID=A0A3S9P568_9BACT|nr:hypothetical protein [Flammeovirga pectinis]AZQ63370.1 hypothetical protein EI427_14310 [Flammeovirga pectinis]
MNTKLLAKVKDACKAAGKSFVFTAPDENDESQVQFQFIGTRNGEEVVMDAFLYTLEMEYFAKIHEEATQLVIEENPKFKDADFDVIDGPHIEALEEISAEIAKNDDYDVAEFVEERPEDADGSGVPLDICLNVPSVTKEVIAKFIKEYNDNTLKLDDTVFSFDIWNEQ